MRTTKKYKKRKKAGKKISREQGNSPSYGMCSTVDLQMGSARIKISKGNTFF